MRWREQNPGKINKYLTIVIIIVALTYAIELWIIQAPSEKWGIFGFIMISNFIICGAFGKKEKMKSYSVLSNHNQQWDSGESTSPSRIRLVEFV